MDINENIKIEFIKKAKILLENDPFININDLLSEHNVIPATRVPRPSPDEIEAAGYKHDGHGNIIGKRFGKILKGSSSGKGAALATGTKWYKVSNLNIEGYRSTSCGTWGVKTHILVFALVHRRWPRQGYVIDHIDNDTLNNHPDNLREITHHENNPHIKLKSFNYSETTKKINDDDGQGRLDEFFE